MLEAVGVTSLISISGERGHCSGRRLTAISPDNGFALTIRKVFPSSIPACFVSVTGWILLLPIPGIVILPDKDSPHK